MDQKTLTKAVEKHKERYQLDKIVVVTDRGLNGGSNLEFLCNEGHDFLISYTLKRSTKDLKDMIFDTTGWILSTNKESRKLLANTR